MSRYNADLANSLGILLNRTLKYGRDRIAEAHCSPKSTALEKRDRMKSVANLQACESYRQLEQMDNVSEMNLTVGHSQCVRLALRLQSAIILVEISSALEAREDQIRFEELLDAVLYHLAESLRIIAILISPVLPKAAHGIFDQLNWKMELSGKEERFSLADAEWGDCRMDMLSANRCRCSRGSKSAKAFDLTASIPRRQRVRRVRGRGLRRRNEVSR